MDQIIFETDCDQSQLHLHEEMEILFALSGRIAVSAAGVRFVMDPEGIMVFNPFEAHQITREAGGHSLSLYIPMELLNQAKMNRVSCCSALQPEKAVYLDILRDKLAALFLEYQNSVSNELHRMSCVFSLLGVLRQEFEESGEKLAAAGSDREWIDTVLSYIREHLGERIDLHSAAEAMFFSPGHLSRKFRRLTGVAFSDYVREHRLKTAENLLLSSRMSVTEIAVSCGFANPNTLISSFQQRYGCTPGHYRRSHRDTVSVQTEPAAEEISYMSLTRYTNHDDRNISFSQETESVQPITIDLKKEGKALRMPHNVVSALGYASDLLLEPLQRAFRRAVRENGFQYVVFHGIFNESMDVYHVNESGHFWLNFNYVDMVLDFLVSLEVKPWIVLDHTPPQMVPPQKRNFFGPSCVNLPEDLDQWEEVVAGLLEHLVDRYGMTTVQTWFFSPEQAVYEYYDVFTLEEYQQYYARTFRTVRRIVPNALIPGFGLDTGIVTLPGNESLLRLLKYSRENDCIPDMLFFQSFGCDYQSANLTKAEKMLVDRRQDQLEEPVPASSDPDLTKHQLAAIKTMLQAAGFASLPIVYAVWTNTIWDRDPGNDTCFKSAWIVKNVLENAEDLTWGAIQLTEFTAHSLVNPNVFHGGGGVISYLGFPKAGYHALTLLGRLRGEMIASGDGYFVTCSGKEVMIMLYHYCHYDKETHLSHLMPEQEQRIYDRYYGFERKGPKNFRFLLENLAEGVYESDTYLVNRSHGSSYDVWAAMGAPEHFFAPQQDYLDRVAVPNYQFNRYLVDETGSLFLSVLLEPHEIRLIHLKKR